jgi:hypothetical protein
MRSRAKRIVGWVAIYAVALHILMLGLVPFNANGTDAVDPYSVICHSAVPAGQAGDETPSRPDLIPGHACEHCNLANAVAPPPAPDVALFANMAPARVLHVLRPVSAPPRAAVTSDPKLARGPPQIA